MAHSYEMAQEAQRANEIARHRNQIEVRKADALAELAKATSKSVPALIAALEKFSEAFEAVAKMSPKLDALNEVLANGDADEVDVDGPAGDGPEFSLAQTFDLPRAPKLYLIPKDAIADLSAPTAREINGAIKDGTAVRIDSTPRVHITQPGASWLRWDLHHACFATCKTFHTHIARRGIDTQFWAPGLDELYRSSEDSTFYVNSEAKK